MRRNPFLALPLLLLFSVAAFAKDDVHRPVVFDPARFDEQKERLLDAITTGEVYRSISPSDEDKVRKALDRMSRNLDGVTSIDALDGERKMAVFNDQEIINTALTSAAEDSRVVCLRETPVGTRIGKRVCKTVAERRQEREAAQEALRQAHRTVLEPQG